MTHLIKRLGHQGDGIADGPIYAQRTLPGEVVRGTLADTRLTDIKIVETSEDRVKPPCPHYNGCGGCQVMHASDDFVATWKRQVIVDALGAHGIEGDVGLVETSPPASRRRATVAVRRTKKGAMAGFHGRGSGTIVAIPKCQVLTPGLVAALPMVEELGALLCSRKAEVSVAITESAAGLDVYCTGGKPLDGPLRSSLGAFAGQHNLARLACDGEPMAQGQPPAQTFGKASVVPPSGAFLQATEHGQAVLVQAVRDIVGKADKVVDLFAGCGTFALPLAETAEVHAVEGSRDMTKALDAGWRAATGLKRVTTEARDLFRRPLLPIELEKFDAAVIDPPRAGAVEQMGYIIEAKVPCVAHVSCNPVTFAREAASLVQAGYKMGPVRVIDQFRWSTHVELVVGFTLK